MVSVFGEKWAKRLVKWIVVALLVTVVSTAIITLKSVVGAVDGVVQRVHEGSFSWNILLGTIVTLVSFVAVLMVTTIVATLIGWTIRIGLATPVHRKIEATLGSLGTLLKTLKEQGLGDEQVVGQLLSDTENLQKTWNESWSTRLVRWLLKMAERRGSGRKGKAGNEPKPTST